MSHAMEIDQTGTVTATPGVDYGGTMTVMHIDPAQTQIVVHRTGTKYWAGLGRAWNYSPAQYMIFEIIEAKGDGRFWVENVGSFPAQASERAAQAESMVPRIFA